MNENVHMESLIAVENTNTVNDSSNNNDSLLVETGFTSRDDTSSSGKAVAGGVTATAPRKLKSEKSREINASRNEDRDSGCSGNNRKVSVLRQNKVSASKFIAKEGDESEADSAYAEVVKGKKSNNKSEAGGSSSRNKK
jgi:hypothetical protein